ncbi:GntR family transcriptional regulator [Sphingopyxis sp.]|uniref:GntR family transcriptional regulator n=1 Tax=Sphingopyxis sp. TaxID=1908224 RepID=UPI002B45DDC9|nr:GntR family transcriptional regulator [Sphingopyxis sp.]HJS09778.1 GntR family transcriptional regulator [Sphingopyxis sp.]
MNLEDRQRHSDTNGEGDANPKAAPPLTPFERAYRGILRGLYEGSLVPGQRLIAPDLMHRFGVGRGTIREVLHRLASTGVVTIIPNRGAVVRQLTRQEVGDLLDVVEVMLGLAARGAARNLKSPEDRQSFKDLQAHLTPESSGGSFPDFLRVRENYYRFIVRMSQNQELRSLFPDAHTHIMRVQLRTFGRAADSEQPGDFIQLTEAILSGDELAAEAAGRRHVDFTRARVSALPDRAFAPEP